MVRRALTASALVVAACGAPEPPGTQPGSAGLVVVCSDYQSTNVAMLAADGSVLTPSLIHSGSADPVLSAALSGDVVVPTMPLSGSDLVLIDRYPASVATWVDVRRATVRAQLSVATGFVSNPQDYLDVAADRAYLPRFEQNPDPGREPFDAGSDLLVVDPTGPALRATIDLRPALEGTSGSLPRPSALVAAAGSAWVLLGAYAPDFQASAESRLVEIDPASDTILRTHVLTGLHGCGAIAVEPGGGALAVACAGEGLGTATPDTSSAALVVVELPSLAERGRWTAAQIGLGAFSDTVAWPAAGKLLSVALGRFDDEGSPIADDVAFELDIGSSDVRELLRSSGTPYTLGDVRCIEQARACFVADALAEGGVVHRLALDASSSLEPPEPIVVERAIGLPPRYLGEWTGPGGGR